MKLLDELILHEDKNLHTALKALDGNAKQILFIVDSEQKLRGTLTDGDIRRALIRSVSLEARAGDVANTNYVALSHHASIDEIQRALTSRNHIIPLLDERGVVVDYSSLSKIKRMPILEPLLGGNELEYLTECIKTNWISSQGRFVSQFEEYVRSYTGAPYALAVSNGTVALHLALVTLGVGHGDEVIVPNLTFAASINAILHAGATPVIVDIDPADWNISLTAIENALTDRTAAIMPVDIYGVPCQLTEIRKLADKHQLRIIEDAAEALGAKEFGLHVGTLADAACYSFFGNKVITSGEGGAITFRNEADYERARILRDHGMSPSRKYWHLEVGYNYRLTNLQAAVGCAQFEQLNEFRAKRKQIFDTYRRYLNPDKHMGLVSQQIREGVEPSYWLYTVMIKGASEEQRDQIIKRLGQRGIDARPAFYPLGDMPVYQQHCKTECPMSREVSYATLSLPTSVYLTEEDIARVCAELANSLDLFNTVRL